jgi:hypothetical protein
MKKLRDTLVYDSKDQHKNELSDLTVSCGERDDIRVTHELQNSQDTPNIKANRRSSGFTESGGSSGDQSRLGYG